jgi:hypothetical protein
VRIGRVETFNTDQVEVNLAEDREQARRRIEYFDGNGACYVTIFAGPLAAGAQWCQACRQYAVQRPDWLAGHIGLELANPSARYLIGFAWQFGLR